jgi:hypothetical protein
MFSWIKASERLPENADRVLALRKGFNKKYYWAVTAQYLYKFNAWFTDDGDRIEVDYWTTIPDLPKSLLP